MKSTTKKGLAAAITAALSITGLTSAVSAHTNTAPDKYIIKGDETFWTISKQQHIPLDQLLAVNPMTDPYNLYPSVVINLPTDKKSTVSIKSTPTPTVKAATASVQTASVHTVSGQALAYKQVISAKATAYTSAQAENAWGPIDYFGNHLKLGTIAVDPAVIPLGSKLYITGYSFSGLPIGGLFGTATDTGSAINGSKVDIFIPASPSQAAKFGVQNVKVYILK